MIEFRTSVADDFKRIKLRPEQAQVIEGENLDIFMKDILFREQCYTLLKDGEVLAIGTIIQYEPKKCYAWILVAKDIGYSLVHLAKRCKRIIDIFADCSIEIHVEENDAAGKRYAEFFGFKPKGRVDNIYRDYNAILYKRDGKCLFQH